MSIGNASRHAESPPALQKKRKADPFPYLIAAPALLILLGGMLYPVSWAIFHSFSFKQIALPASFVGWENYKYLFNDPIYLKSVVNTVYFTVGAMFWKVLLGLVVALILNLSIRSRNFIRTMFLLPWTLPSIVAIYIWMWLYSGNGGLINNILLKAGVISSGIAWLSDKDLSMVSLMIVNIWRGVPFIALSILSGLQTIPHELYESAKIDGANTFAAFRFITLPLITSVMLVATLISTIWTINDFETVYLLTGGGPGQSTYTIPLVSFRYAFDSAIGNIGRACAAAMSTLPILLLLIRPILKNLIGREW